MHVGSRGQQLQHVHFIASNNALTSSLFGRVVVEQIARADAHVRRDQGGGHIGLAIAVEQFQRDLPKSARRCDAALFSPCQSLLALRLAVVSVCSANCASSAATRACKSARVFGAGQAHVLQSLGHTLFKNTFQSIHLPRGTLADSLAMAVIFRAASATLACACWVVSCNLAPSFTRASKTLVPSCCALANATHASQPDLLGRILHVLAHFQRIEAGWGAGHVGTPS
jgi:hypothetical protein